MNSYSILFTLCLVILLGQSSLACDGGCSISTTGTGMLEAFRNNRVSLGWYASPFQRNNEQGQTKDFYHSIEVSSQYYLANRFRVAAFLPYHYKTRLHENERLSQKGIGDLRLLGSYTLLNNVEIGDKTKLFWAVDAGVKLPTGKYNADLHDEGMPLNFNAGNGSWGFIAQQNMVLTHKEFGLVLGQAYTYSLKTKSTYQYGQQFSSKLLFFWEKELANEIKLILNTGLTAEWVGADRHANGKVADETGGKGLFLATGINFKLKDWQLGFSYAQPLHQNYLDEAVKAKGRLACQLSFNF